jgi:hypothetical protein
LKDVQDSLRSLCNNRNLKKQIKEEENKEEIFNTTNNKRNYDNNNKKKASNNNQSSNQHYNLKKKKNNKNNSNNDSTNKCEHCGRIGHTKYYCRHNPESPNYVISSQKQNKNKKHSVNYVANIFEDNNNAEAYNLGAMEYYNQNAFNRKRDSNEWLIDTGATSNICYDKSKFISIDPCPNIPYISGFNGGKSKVYGRGKVALYVEDDEHNIHKVTLSNTLYVPDSHKNMISVKTTMREHGYTFLDTSQFLINRKYKYTINNNDTLFYIKETEPPTVNSSEECYSTINLWHARLGHQNHRMIFKLKDAVDGMEITSNDYTTVCDVCNTSKFPSTPFNKSETRASKPLELIHSDVSGPARIPAFGGARYVVSFIDDYSRYQRTYLMKYKSETLDKFKEFLNSVGMHSKDDYKTLRTDSGGEYISKVFKSFCKDNRINQQFTIPHTPQQNGVAERNWRSLMDITRSLLNESKLEKRWWGMAVLMATHIKNRSLTSGNGSDKTPYELFYGKKPDLSNLKIFGSTVYYKNEAPNASKLDNKGRRGIFLGFNYYVKGYQI